MRSPINAINNPTTIGKKAISVFEDDILNIRILISNKYPIRYNTIIVPNEINAPVRTGLLN